MSESKVLLFQLLLQFLNSVLQGNVGNKMQFLVVNCSSVIVVVEVLSLLIVKSRTTTVKTGILYQTCTGPDVTIIG